MTMKKILLLITIIALGSITSAQINSKALGIRLYGGDNFSGAELSFQKGLSQNNRVEFDASFGVKSDNTRLALIGIYHWVWNIDSGLNWYVGPGASISFDNYSNNNSINIGLGGQLGIEYNFNDLPLLISLDTRPMWDFLGDVKGLGWGAALGFRYTW